MVFVLCNIVLVSTQLFLAKWQIDYAVLIIANSLFLLLNLITFYTQYKALQNSNPNVFIRSVMAGMMVKMFACMIAIIVYWFTMGEKFSRPTVFCAMLIYLVYLVVEVTLVTKLNRQKHA